MNPMFNNATMPVYGAGTGTGVPGTTTGTGTGAALLPGAGHGPMKPGIGAGQFPGTGGFPGMFVTSQGTGGIPISPPPVPSGFPITPGGTVLPATQEESYVENILRMNLGKVATIYMTFENNSEWNAKIFKGVLEAAGRDHIIVSDPVTGRRFLLLTVNLDYITFDQPLTYALPFGRTAGGTIGT